MQRAQLPIWSGSSSNTTSPCSLLQNWMRLLGVAVMRKIKNCNPLQRFHFDKISLKSLHSAQLRITYTRFALRSWLGVTENREGGEKKKNTSTEEIPMLHFCRRNSIGISLQAEPNWQYTHSKEDIKPQIQMQSVYSIYAVLQIIVLFSNHLLTRCREEYWFWSTLCSIFSSFMTCKIIFLSRQSALGALTVQSKIRKQSGQNSTWYYWSQIKSLML